jgi:tol-pal system protein YbgF
MPLKLRTLYLTLLLATALPARAGLFDDNEARQRMEQIRQEQDARLQKLESGADAASRSQLLLNNQIEALKQELAQIRGQVELLTNDQDQIQKRQKDFYVDLDNRLRKLESAATASPAQAGQSGPAAQGNTAADPAQETRDYEAAINLLRGGKHVDAAFGFKQFIKNWPKSAFMPGAHFWLAASLLQARDFEGAKENYNRVYAIWPEDTLAPDAMLGEANATQELGDAKSARAVLEKLVAKYPSSDAAKTAKQRLGSNKKK